VGGNSSDSDSEEEDSVKQQLKELELEIKQTTKLLNSLISKKDSVKRQLEVRPPLSCANCDRRKSAKSSYLLGLMTKKSKKRRFPKVNYSNFGPNSKRIRPSKCILCLSLGSEHLVHKNNAFQITKAHVVQSL
jgi:hypothetical protein